MGDADCMLKVNEVIKPQLSAADVPQLLLRCYGLVTATIKQFVSYDDLNFHVTVESSPITNSFISAVHYSGYVLKVLNSMDSRNPDMVDGQNKMMLYLSNKGYECSVPVKNKQGDHMSLEALGQDTNSNPAPQHLVRLLTFVSSTVLCSVPLTPALCRGWGRYMEQLQVDMQEFGHPAIAARQFVWMMARTSDIRQFVHVVKDKDKLDLVTTALHKWETRVLPVMDKLPKGYVHGDFNEQNIMVTATPETAELTDPTYNITGVIDFGDISVSCYVFDLSVSVTAVLTLGKTVQEAGDLLAGYCEGRPLRGEEWNVLWECVCSRLAVSLVMGAYSHSLDPANSYVLTTAKSGWRALRSLLRDGKQDTVAVWRAAVL